VDPAAAERAVEALRGGGFAVLAEARTPDASASLVIAAERVTTEAVNFMTRQAYGLVRLALSDERCEELGLHSSEWAADSWRPTVSISARDAGPTGASAADRARTVRMAADPAYGRADFVVPGHVFPLRARPGGVLRRAGRTEAAVDLAALAGYRPAAAVTLVLDEDGSVATGEALAAYAERHGLPLVTIHDVVAYRRSREKLVERVAGARLPTPHGGFAAVAFREAQRGAMHVALVRGDVAGASDVLVRVHRRCLAGDVFRATTCSCANRLERALERLAAEDAAVLVYLLEGEDGDTRVDPHDLQPERPEEYGIGAQILADLGVTTIRVLGDQPRPIPGLEGFGLRVTGYVPFG
jgi:3,4-dihydroxy 2-butanone 4-phosphate synthase/GTP cyclohydrolase II